MAKVGILGENSNEMAAIFSQICRGNKRNALVGYHKISENNPIPIVTIDIGYEYSKPITPLVFILQETTNYAQEAIKLLDTNGYLIVNADESVPSPTSRCGIITYGFNAKASVTASSVADGALQVCIQRGFKSLNGSPCEPQEFKAPCPEEANPLDVLGAVTACVVCDVLSKY